MSSPDPQPATADPRMEDLERIYRQNVRFVWQCVRRMGVAPDRAEDAVQDVFAVVAKQLQTFEGRSSVRTWLFSIVFRVVREHRRAESRHRRSVPGPSFDPTTPEAVAQRTEAARILESLLDELPAEQRAVFVLSEMQQMEAPEIAQALDVNVNTVYSRRRIAREKIERSLRRLAAGERRRLAWTT